ncbi:glycosyltransferase family 2 protein [Paenibacillus spiritus]|uniref:Glycosyltransferase family 2 protein n=1 Tax=Paenibacillus spiritus TaxID=2496557 RepID=A0A5J5G075_9BACL|nr:glycosyltransferase family 2 protein [Paenibacillus spiritus]KAA8999714.1 glycosyltransferase family 2 protein [Paenibacillus spiritus]
MIQQEQGAAGAERRLMDALADELSAGGGRLQSGALSGEIRALADREETEFRESLDTLARLAIRQADGRDAPGALALYLRSRPELDGTPEAERLAGVLAKLRTGGSAFRESAGSQAAGKEAAPKVSVIITTYNRRDFLKQAVESILAQDYPNKEVTVIDDASTDGTDTLMRGAFGGEERVFYMRNEANRGPGVNRLAAFEAHGDGEFVLFLDDDDYLIDPGYFSRAVAFHREHPGLSFVAANVFLEYTAERRLDLQELGLAEITGRRDFFLNFERPGYGKPASTLTTVFRRQALIDMNISQMNMVNDSSIYLRSLLVGDAGFIDCVAGVYRIHGSNITFSLSRDFLVRNLEEKRSIRQLALDRYGYRNQELTPWFENTSYDTIVYYLRNSAKTSEDYSYMFRWTRDHCPGVYGQVKREFGRKRIKKQILQVPLVRMLVRR